MNPMSIKERRFLRTHEEDFMDGAEPSGADSEIHAKNPPGVFFDQKRVLSGLS